MKLIPFLLLALIISCSSRTPEPLPQHLKNVKPGNLQFFETYHLSEIATSWNAACKWINDHDSLAQNPRGLDGLVQPHTDYMIGYVNEENMSRVNDMLAIPEVKAKFPKNVQFMWSYAAEEVQDYHKMFGLYAIKVPDGGKAIINGEHIETAGAGASEVTGQPIITIKMTDPGAHDWEIMTRKNIGRAIAITLDNQVLSCPLVYDVIKGGSTEISGTFTKEEAEELAARIYKGKKK